ncbi:MAG: S41 family peptidase [Phycisphaerales bacterium]
MTDPRAFAVLALAVLAPVAGAGEVDLPRFPALSPDGERITFSWRGDLWSASTEGGEAVRLTSHPADEGRSAWSPDGTKIAFESDRDGPRAIYVMDANGSNVRRASLTDDSLTLCDWAAAGLLVSGRFEGDVYRSERPYVLDPAGGEPVRLHDAFGQHPAGLDDAGDARVIFERGGSRTTRRHYRGPDDRDLFLYDPAGDTFTRLTDWAGNDWSPAFRDDDTVLYLSDREDDTMNVYAMDLDRGEAGARRLTEHTDRDVTALAVSGDGRTVAYIKWDGLHVARFTGDRLRDGRRLRLVAPADASPRDELMNISSDVEEGAVSPDGGTLAVVAMGDVFVRATEEDAPTRRVTDSMARARDVAWSMDNTTLYFTSDEGGAEAIYAATVTLTRDELKEGFEEATSGSSESEEEPAAEDETTEPDDTDASDADDADENASDDEPEKKDEKKDKGPTPDERWGDALRFDVRLVHESEANIIRDLSPSPDGTRLAFRETRGDLRVLDLETGEVTTLLESWDFGTEFRWSPDGRWIAYATDDSDFNTDIFVVPADGSAPPVNLTRHPDPDYSPRWSADGKILAFLSTRTNDEADVHIVMLDRDLEAMTGAELDAYFDEANKAVKKLGALDPPSDDEDDAEADAVDGAEESEPEAYEAPFTTEDLETAYLRLRRVTRYEGFEGSLELSGDGSTIVFSTSTGPDGPGLYTIKWDGSDADRIGSSASVQHVTRDGQTLVTIRSGAVRTMPVKGGKETSHPIRAEKRIDHARLSAQKFDEMSRELGATFYHPDMKGLDWQGLTDDYRALAERAHTPDEFAWVGSYFLGELNASHLGVWGGMGGYRAGDYRPAGSLAIDATRMESEDDGRWAYRVDRVLPLATTQAGEMGLQAGDVITEIDFEPFGARDTLDTMLAGKTGDEVVLTVRRTIEGEAKDIHLLRTPVSRGEVGRLRYDDWQRSRAALVDEWSGGRIGYLHIRAMGGADLIEFERDLFAAAEGKDGLLIDVRSNGGGWTTDRVLASIMYEPHAYTIPRGAHPVEGRGYPRDRLFIQKYNLPINMLCNEKSFSNAEIISHAFKTLGRGTLVGEETYGGVISTGGFSLMDGTFVRRPFRGWFLPDGTDMENHGAMPDIRVEQTPEDESEEIDRQLRAAVDDLMQRLD